MTAPREKALAAETAGRIVQFLEDECSLLPECVSPADRANVENAIVNAIAAHPAPIAANDGGTDYEAKARDADAIMANSYNSTTPLRELIAAALAQSADSAREKALAEAEAWVRPSTQQKPPSLRLIVREMIKEWRDREEIQSDLIAIKIMDACADAIATLAKTKGEER